MVLKHVQIIVLNQQRYELVIDEEQIDLVPERRVIQLLVAHVQQSVGCVKVVDHHFFIL